MPRTIDPAQAGRLLASLRKTYGAGPGRPRIVKHVPRDPQCSCVECRKARGHYPPLKNPRARNPLKTELERKLPRSARSV